MISKKSNMLQTGKFSKKVSSTGKPQASFRYLAKGTWYVAARSWVLDEQGNKVYGSWTKIKKIKITVVTPQQPKIKNITVKGNTVTVTYTNAKMPQVMKSCSETNTKPPQVRNIRLRNI